METLSSISHKSKFQLVAAGICAYGLWKFCRGRLIIYRVSKKIEKKKKLVADAFQQVKRNLAAAQLSGEEIKRIVDLPFQELHAQLQDGTLKATDVLHAYQAYALEVNDRINCITEPILDAEEIALALDSQTGTKGPLHGIPVSLKEAFDLVGNNSTAGIGHLLDDIKSEDAVLVQVLKDMGAVPFVRTNIPQLMMTYECSNPIFGVTHNPHDITRTPGGSSGGEAAIIGARASIVGLGTDVGGSIRVPAHFCGCYGLKATVERFSGVGFSSLGKGQTLVAGGMGPMTRDFPALVAVSKALLSDLHFHLDPFVPPIKFRDEIYEATSPLTIGFYVDDGYLKAVPACGRAVLMAKQALESLGHTVVPFTPPRTTYMYINLIKTFRGDQGKQFISKLEQDIIDRCMYVLTLGTRLPDCLAKLLYWTAQILGQDRVAGEALRARFDIKTVYDWFQHKLNVQSYRREFLQVWREKNLDAVICPPFATTAVKTGTVEKLVSAGSYAMMYNFLNWPSGSLPVTRVTTDDVSNMKDYPSTRISEKTIKKSAVGSEGLPVNVMCASVPFQEEIVLRVMRDIEKGLIMMKQ